VTVKSPQITALLQVRCIISGPQDTPYEGGLFVFDVYFPPGYPNVPPL
jgi:ubiquitin-protein ligase